MSGFTRPRRWSSPSTDPNDATFGDLVEAVDSTGGDWLADTGGAIPADGDVVLVGEPFDAAVIGRRGAAGAPDAIREALAGVKTHHFDLGAVADDPARDGGPTVVDIGDVDVASTDAATIQRRVASRVAGVYDAGAIPVFLGGDNSMTVANVEPLLERRRAGRTVGVVNLDAHLDVREVREGPTSGTPYRQLLEAGLDRYVCLGARHHETSTAYARFLADHGGTVVTSEAVGRDLEGALARARDAVSDVDVLYVSVDCDVLDAAAAPGVSAPTPGGLQTRELFRLVRRLAGDDRVAGFEVVECAPPLEDGDLTVDAAARTVAHFLTGRLAGGSRD